MVDFCSSHRTNLHLIFCMNEFANGAKKELLIDNEKPAIYIA